MSIKILDSKNEIKLTDVNNLMKQVGWGDNYYQKESVWKRVLEASTHIAYIKENEKLISFGRILEDGVMCMFYDICVHPDYQNKNIGTLLMNHLLDKVKDGNYVSIGLFVWEGNKTASDFYGKLGFEKVTAMEIKKYMRKV